jgi:nucleotide-binding universal stress UspA family protein
MFKNILVPLDGSKLAEMALPPVASLAQAFGARVTLLHVIEKDAPQTIHHEHHLTQADEAGDYLKQVAAQSFPPGTPVATHVHTAAVQDVAASIIHHASEEFSPDLIAMCAHGSGGFRDLMFGPIAQQVVAGGETALLLLRPRRVEIRPFVLRRVLVPLDSESIHDEILCFAWELAKAYGAELYLLTVIPTYGTLSGEKAAVGSLLPATATALLDIQAETAKEHLQTHLNELLAAGYDANAEVGRGDPTEVIVATATRIGADLILLGTHRKVGMKAFWARSVAPNVVRKTHLPSLLVPILSAPRRDAVPT